MYKNEYEEWQEDISGRRAERLRRQTTVWVLQGVAAVVLVALGCAVFWRH